MFLSGQSTSSASYKKWANAHTTNYHSQPFVISTYPHFNFLDKKMSNNHTTKFVFLFFILLPSLLSTSAVHPANAKPLWRKLLLSSNSLFVTKAKSSGSTLEPEKAMENGPRKRPPSASNPTQNK
ncbi:hypothetical protein AAHA92_18326 [Salvia divinorum]|uniref:Uncharacterized protein n=1 Tax=Salvia divinorum TaxID=28513 RepID=A0ABD1H271_SALDI